MLPNRTEEQLVATAFHRNTQTNDEGGADDEEFRNVAVVDRVAVPAAFHPLPKDAPLDRLTDVQGHVVKGILA